ncbi:NAD-dependent dihydropyrimidine dehydrogenase subunit PreA, partial [Desulfovibrio sp. OttesenSCG-928-A18]|nr:NAD-dependent dihydropyrimidine dehydrogenase subunit PreA [Desulfovibrio sp. OttesenSCG-928-A18]
MNKKKAIWLRHESARCLLCQHAPCSAACPHGLTPDKWIRNIRFENMPELSGNGPCGACDAPCEKACPHPDFPLRIKKMLGLAAMAGPPAEHADISLDFCGIPCANPFFLGSSVVASNYDMCSRAFEAGWGGLVYKTVCMMPLQEVSPRFDAIGKEGTAFIGFRNLEQLSDKPLRHNLETLTRLKKNYPGHVVVASIMGRNAREWAELAALVTDAGVDMVECNFSCPNMKDGSLGAVVGCDSLAVAEYTAAARQGTHLPLLAKMTPNITDMVLPALAAVRSGASGLAAINTLKSLTGILEEDKMVGGKTAISGYSGKAVKPVALRFIADLKNCAELRDVPLSGIGGIETWYDAAEYFALGCENVQVVTAVMQYGYRIIEDLKEGLERFLPQLGYRSLRECIGFRLDAQTKAEALDRASVTYPLINQELCVGCGRCYISCRDGGHQAMEFERRKASVNGKRCVGCHLCSLVCPTGAIG